MTLVLATDLDGTLFPNGPAPESPGAAAAFRRLAARDDVSLVFVTGRDPRRVEEAIDGHALPRPDFVISDVGAAISKLRGREWEPSKSWWRALRDDWPDGARDRLRAAFAEVAELREQESDRQSEFKLSYDVPARDLAEDLLESLGDRADSSSVGTQLVWSVAPDGSQAMLDVMPPRASKLGALGHLLAEFGLEALHVVFAGDSGNDLDVLTSRVNAVLVANAHDDVRRRAVRESERLGTLPFLHLAQGGFLGMNGNYAAGVLEGVAHFHADLGRWLEDF